MFEENTEPNIEINIFQGFHFCSFLEIFTPYTALQWD